MSQPGSPRGEHVQPRHYLSIVRRRGWIVALAAIAAATSGFALSSRRAPIYVAQAKVFIGPGTDGTGDLASALNEITLSGEFLTSYAEAIKSRPLAGQVVSQEKLPFSPQALAARVSTVVVTNTRIIVVSVSDSDPARAQRTVNTLATDFVSSSAVEFGGKTGVLASVLEPALAPTSPVSPKPKRDAALLGFLGLSLGLGCAVLLEQIDNRILSRDDVELAFGPLPILAAIPEASGSRKRTLFFTENKNSHVGESFRILRTNAQFFSMNEPLGRVLVTSPHGKDGKTTVAVNLAASLAASGLRTVLVEADLRRPCASTYFELPPAPGLSDVLVGRSEVSEAIRATGVANLRLVPAGTVPPNPSELLGSKLMVSILDELAADGSVVVLDSPPALVVTDAAVLAAQMDGIVLVVRAGRTHRDGAREVKRLFERIGAPVLGVVINCASRGDDYSYPHRYYRYLRKGDAPLPSENKSNGHVEPGTTSMPGQGSPLQPDHEGESVPPLAPALRAGPPARHRSR